MNKQTEISSEVAAAMQSAGLGHLVVTKHFIIKGATKAESKRRTSKPIVRAEAKAILDLGKREFVPVLGGRRKLPNIKGAVYETAQKILTTPGTKGMQRYKLHNLIYAELKHTGIRRDQAGRAISALLHEKYLREVK